MRIFRRKIGFGIGFHFWHPYKSGKRPRGFRLIWLIFTFFDIFLRHLFILFAPETFSVAIYDNPVNQFEFFTMRAKK
jgi:hypothetical protein